MYFCVLTEDKDNPNYQILKFKIYHLFWLPFKCFPFYVFIHQEFEIDTTVKEEVFIQIDKKIQEAKMKVSWITEKHSLSLMKLKKL